MIKRTCLSVLLGTIWALTQIAVGLLWASWSSGGWEEVEQAFASWGRLWNDPVMLAFQFVLIAVMSIVSYALMADKSVE